ncbi:hypothetical protein FRC07_005995 [Ceratobasidium sp. 392]|nr:hypothetical protein FRC07_005995 [Ceratobasidium sp. 392]
MHYSTPVSEGSTPSAQALATFHDVASSLAAAAEALSKASQTLATAAHAMSDVDFLRNAVKLELVAKDESIGFGSKSVYDLVEYESEESATERDSEGCLSEASSGDIIDYDEDEDDFNFPLAVVPRNPATVPHDPTTTVPCFCGPMDMSQIRLSPYPQQPLQLQSPMDTNEHGNNLEAAQPELQAEPIPVEPSAIMVPGVNSDAETSENARLALGMASFEKTASRVAFKLSGSGSNSGSPISPTYPKGAPLTLQESAAAYPKLPWGRNYIQLEEDFDAIPIISCMALASKKTICFVPSPESLDPYKKILNSITKLDVLIPQGGVTPVHIEAVMRKFAASTSPVILILAFHAIPTILPEVASVDCIMHWGWPENRQNYVKMVTLMKLHTRSCLILPSGDHLKPLKDSQPSDYGVVKYPDTVLGSYFGPKSPINEIRRITTQALTDIGTETPEALYHSWLEYYGIGSTRRGDWTVFDLMNHARGYAAKTLLRGPASDGSKIYPPICGRQLSIPEWVIGAIDALQPVSTQPSTSPEPRHEVQVEVPP